MFHTKLRAWHKEFKTMYKIKSIDFQDEFVELEPFMKSIPNSEYKEIGLAISAAFEDVVLIQESGLQDDKKLNVFEGDLIRFEGELFIVNYGHYGDETTKVNGYGWYLYGKEFTFLYVGGGEKVGTFFENPELLEA